MSSEKEYHHPVDQKVYEAEGGWRKYEPETREPKIHGKKVNIGNVRLLMPEEEIAAQTTVMELATFTKEAERLAEDTFNGSNDQGVLLVQFDCVPSGHEVRLAYQGHVSEELLRQYYNALKAVRKLSVKNGKVLFQIELVVKAHAQSKIRIAAYCLMPNHWHLLLWPRHDGELSEVLRWITITHTQRWHAHHQSAGTGAVYQGRFKSFPVQTDEHFLTVAYYIERNALRAQLADRAEDWQWSSLWRRVQTDSKFTSWLSDWPMERPMDWTIRVNRPHTASELEALRVSAQRGRPFGNEGWIRGIAKRFGMESTLRPRGRPKGS